MHSVKGRSALWMAGLIIFLLSSTGAVFGQHPPVTLYTTDYDTINPLTGENADKPFSTEATCGSCHDYETITSGYHFQMGWDKISDDFSNGDGRPWSLSDGLMGRWYPYQFRQLAKKKNSHADEIDLTVYDFVGFSSPASGEPPCGACHPGGAGLQYDRDGNRYDQTLAGDPSLRDSLDGDYYRSNWDKSGVVEADCFICHLPRYDFTERVSQLTKGNYQWAVIAGTGLGIVEGSVKNGDEPTVTYNKRFFNEDGTVVLPMTWPPPSENCVYCHGTADVKKRGFSWKDLHNSDVHEEQGMECVSCHTAGEDHQITKGDEYVSSVADELDNSMRSCRECHDEGSHGASVPRHSSVRPSHLDRLSCESCHIPQLHLAAALYHEASSGELVFTTNPPEAEGFGAHADWSPVYEIRNGNSIYPLNKVFTMWWGNLDNDGVLYPLFLREHKAGWEIFGDEVTDDNGDEKPEVNRPEEIVAGLKAHTQTLDGNQRFQQVHPVYIKAGVAWHLDEAGELSQLDYDLTGLDSVTFSINHNVAPARMALGANGCGDCHDPASTFFTGLRIVDPYDATGQPAVAPRGLSIGCNPTAFRINAFHQQILSPVVSVSIIFVVFLIVVHYHSYRPKRIPFEAFSHEVYRFRLVERGVHLFRMIAFFVLAVTGVIMAFNSTEWQELLFRSPQQMLDLHIWFGIIFIVTTVMGIVIWFEDALYADHDKEWVKIVGGYLGHKGHVPAGRFNAGQKMFYWFTVIFGLVMSVTGLFLVFKDSFPLAHTCITSTVHNLASFFLIAGVLSHAYLGTVANPGTWRVLVDGYVSKAWAEHHHPYWYHEMLEKEESGEKKSGVRSQKPE